MTVPVVLIKVNMCAVAGDVISIAFGMHEHCITLTGQDSWTLMAFFSLSVDKIIVINGTTGNLAQVETLVLNVSGRILMVNKENNGNTTENLVSITIFYTINAVHCNQSWMYSEN